MLRVLFVAVLVLLIPAAAIAAPELRTRVDADTIAVGDDVHLTLEAMSTEGEPLDAQPGATGSFQVLGVSPSTSMQISIVNGVQTAKRGATVTWTLRAQRTGMWTIGPPSVRVGAQRFSGKAITIKVVPPGQAPAHRPPARTQNPFDPWSLFPFDIATEPPRQPQVQADPTLSLENARAPSVFLHATVDRTRAVVGEQVTLSVLLYVDAMEHPPDLNDRHEATTTDFVRRPLIEGDEGKYLGVAMAGGRLWNVQLIRKWALFPLKTGDLEIGPMTVAHVQSGLQRESEALKVRVTEPPLTGRPPGYAVGDVGKFEIATEVTPREVERGGAVGVTIDLSGTGNLPAQLAVPAREGLEWLAPEVHERVGTVRGSDRFGGKRTFSYVVRAQKEGDLDLGEVKLPYFDPDTRAYGVARAPLGTIHVRPGTAPAQADAPVDVLPGLPDVRPTLAPPRPAARHVVDAPAYWMGLGAAPLAWFVFAGARVGTRRMRARAGARTADPGAEAKARVAEADAANKNGDARAADGATARALEATALAHLGVNLRGTTGEVAADELTRAGLARDEADALVALYGACGIARFAPEAPPADEARSRWSKARALIKTLERASRDVGA